MEEEVQIKEHNSSFIKEDLISDPVFRGFFPILFVFALGALFVGWRLYPVIVPARVQVVESSQHSFGYSSTSQRLVSLRNLEQPHFVARPEPMTALISNFSIPQIEIGAEAALVSDLTAGVDLFAKNPYKVWPIASITKFFTAVAAAEIASQDRVVAVAEEALLSEGVAGNLEAGERFTLREITQLMLLVSSNRAAKAIEIDLGSSLLAQVNEIVTRLGLQETSIVEVTGLSPRNVSTARDLKSIIQYIYRLHPDMLKMTQPDRITISSSVKKHHLTNINYLASHSDIGFLGGKTGTIDESGQNIVALFEYKGHDMVVILLGSSDRFEETLRLLKWVKQAYIFKQL